MAHEGTSADGAGSGTRGPGLDFSLQLARTPDCRYRGPQCVTQCAVSVPARLHLGESRAYRARAYSE